jgi:tetratricopeptide (TPR) repeat protein
VNRLLIFLLGIAIGAAALHYWPRVISDRPERGSAGFFARALAFYLNETNADDRRARVELLSVADTYGDDVAWLLDMALIDLAELNHPVQAEDHILGEPRTYVQLLQSAMQRLERARAQASDDASVAFNLARTYKKFAPHAEDHEALVTAALELLKPLAERDDSDPAALIQYAEILQFERQDWPAAVAAYDRVIGRGKDFVPQTQFRISEWRRANCLLRIDRERGEAELGRLRATYKDPVNPKSDALERGAYTKLREIVPGGAAKTDPRDMNWRMVTQRTLLPALGEPRFLIAPDIDGDCVRDVVLNSAGGLRVLRNRRNATFDDQTERAGFPAGFVCASAALGDLDNDGFADLVVGGPAGARIFLNRTDPEAPTDWKFEELKFTYAKPVRSVALWDMDHDGDVDLLFDGRVGFRTALEKTAQGTSVEFAEVALPTPSAGGPVVDALLLDVDNDHDVDMLVSREADSYWLENLRQMQFATHPLPDGAPLEALDVDHDMLEEVRIGQTLYKFEDGAFQKKAERGPLLDLDGDGFVDPDPLAGLELRGKLLRAIGSDLNRDGGRDLIVVTDQGVDVYMSRPQRPTAWIDVRPRGVATNALGVGAKVRLYSGGLRLGATCRDGLVSFGVGRRTLIDCLLLRWSNGVEQGVVTPNLLHCLEVEEREGEVGSCPFVYTFDGERWHFIADVQSGVPLGLPYADGKYLRPRPNETIFIPGAKLAPKDGVLRVDLTEEFRELLYVDAVVLRAIDHPKDVRPVLNEGFTVMTFPEFRVHGLRDLRPAKKATDQLGRDVTELVSRRDERHAVVFEKLSGGQYTGLAKQWSIELDFGDVPASARTLLVMDGWVEFPTASASIAASQSKTVHFKTPVIDFLAADGTWKRAHSDPGFPAGKGKAVLVDLTGKVVPAGALRLRISSTQRLHWDSFFLATGPDEEIRLTELPLLRAEHGFHGVGKRVEDPKGELPWRYSHDKLETFYRWDQMPSGMLTRYGDVRELLGAIDDRYPILASGDRIRLEFDAAALPPLPEGWVRDYCFTTEGWVKDADLNQAVRESVDPLPFRAMSGYPYDEAKESHPHPDWAKEWRTRPARRLVNPEALGAQGR